MRAGSWGSIHATWKSSPLGAPANASNVLPPSVERYIEVCDTYSRSGFRVSTKTRLKYSLPVTRGSLVDRCQVAPPSSERKNPCSRIAYNRRPPVPGATATPTLPRVFSGRPVLTRGIHVDPPSPDFTMSEVASTAESPEPAPGR